ncbi:DUF6364 family protein [Jiulongibacter sp. NS-SX5]|uniref:DUF6364 family protein n=1 Tax=Jiulongibacter sp. NS-SX5 TaxID=3463854 RepID=UPI0040584D14
MTTKLNLTIDEDLVAKAKVYAAKKKTSVSRLVENLLLKELKKSTKKVSLTKKYSGILNGQLSDNSIGAIKDERV